MPNINPNQFAQVTVRGQLDLNIAKSATVIQGVVSANQATALQAGDAVKMDNTTGNIPTFVAAAVGDDAIGIIVFDEKKSSPVAGDYIQVALLNGAGVMWMTAGATVLVGALLEDSGSRTLVTRSAQKMRGIALDPGTTGNLFRVILRNSVPA